MTQGIVKRIREKCEEKGLTISQLEKNTGLSNASIDKWDKLNQKPSYDKIYRVAETLKVSLDWLLTGKESENLSPEEQKLIELYRTADDRGRRRILRSAEDEAQEQQSSTYRIG